MNDTNKSPSSKSGLGHQAPQPGNVGSIPTGDTRIKRLFKLMVEGKPEYFDNKKLAKIRRDRAYGPDATKHGGVIMRGPDHWKGESFNTATQTPKTVKRSRR